MNWTLLLLVIVTIITLLINLYLIRKLMILIGKSADLLKKITSLEEKKVIRNLEDIL